MVDFRKLMLVKREIIYRFLFNHKEVSKEFLKIRCLLQSQFEARLIQVTQKWELRMSNLLKSTLSNIEHLKVLFYRVFSNPLILDSIYLKVNGTLGLLLNLVKRLMRLSTFVLTKVLLELFQ
jgi:hypothetical protein